MDRAQSSRVEHRSAVRAAGPAAQFVLLRAGAGESRELALDAAHRRAVPGDAVLWPPANGRRSGPRRTRGEPQASAAADACDGPGRAVSWAKNDDFRSRAQGLSVPAAGPDDRPAEPGLVQRHRLRAAAMRLLVPRGGNGLVQPARAGL